jgi:RNA polymerase sigma factor (sigma-70 family)
LILLDWTTRLCREAIPDRNEQIRLGRAIRAWQDHPDGPEAAPVTVIRRGKRALDRLVTGNVRLAVNLARKMHKNGMELDDLIQIAIEGLIGGCRRYDPSRGYSLSTYARWWIVQALLRGRQYETAMYVPVETLHINAKATEAMARLAARLGRSPSFDEIAAELDHRWTPQRLERVVKQVYASRCASLDAAIGNGSSEHTLAETTALATTQDGTDEQLLEAERIEKVRAYLATLEPVERQLLTITAGEGGTGSLGFLQGSTPEGIQGARTLKDLAATGAGKVHQLSARRKTAIRKAQFNLKELAA